MYHKIDSRGAKFKSILLRARRKIILWFCLFVLSNVELVQTCRPATLVGSIEMSSEILAAAVLVNCLR